MTPRELDALINQWTQKQDRIKQQAFLPAGIIVSNLIAPYLREGAEIPSPYQFVPGYQEPDPTPDEQVARMDAFFHGLDTLKKRGVLKPVQKKKRA